VVTNLGAGDHLGLNYITTVEDLAMLKRVIAQNVTPKDEYAVLNAAHPIVTAMANTCPGKVIFFAADRQHRFMTEHRAVGGERSMSIRIWMGGRWGRRRGASGRVFRWRIFRSRVAGRLASTWRT